MKIIAATLIFLLLAQLAKSQAELKSSHRIRVQFFNDQIIQGELISLNDSSVRMIRNGPAADTVIPVKAIKIVSVRRMNAPAKGFLAGLGIGAGIGAGFGYISYSPPSCDSGFCLDFGPGFSAIGGAVVGGVAGGLMGMAMRSSFTPYLIDGRQEAYEIFRNKTFEESISRRQRKRASRTIGGTAAR